jgi:ABC-type lipoprotein release transport system permease subunit
VRPTDLTTLAAAAAALIIVALATCWVPARRASLIDPLEALKGD